MAGKYLKALDYVDLHANTIIKKHAQKRPLGDIETKHRYTPTQPVLSCRTVDIDVSGTRTYRPKSSADIINEQHALIHKIYSKATRNVVSAPPRQSKTHGNSVANKNHQNTNKENNLKSVEIQGRPLTSLSQRQSDRPTSRSSNNKRPKTTGTLKNQKTLHESFMIVRADRELVETRRSYQNLTKKIHRHWDPENHNLNTGTYQRGKKPPGVPSVDSWITFSGSQAEESQGIVDAFADACSHGDYYNVEGSVGSRIAQQLQKGDKIRIGINGNIQTQDLKVKKWMKEGSYIKDEIDVEESKENMANADNQTLPLSWDDQLQSTSAKVITARESKNERTTINLCETRPVVFHKLLPDELGSKGQMRDGKKEGFRVKQRKKNKPGMDGKQQENKVTVITIDSKSREEEEHLQNITVEDVIKLNTNGRNFEKHNGVPEESEKHSVSFSFVEQSPRDLPDNLLSTSKTSIADSVSSNGSEQRHVKVKPTQPTFSKRYEDVDLDIIGTLSVSNGQRPLSNESDQQPSVYNNKNAFSTRQLPTRSGSARSSRSVLKSAKSQKSLGSGSIISFGSGQRPNEAEYIQIAHAVKNPNPSSPQKHTEVYSPQSTARETPRNHSGSGHRSCYSGIREPVPSPELEPLDVIEKENEPIKPETPPPVEVIPAQTKQPAPALSISIPTADYTDSALNSPIHKQGVGSESPPQMKRAKDMRNEQIEQITDMLVDTIITPTGSETEKS